MPDIKVIVEPAAEPVELDDAKAWCRIDGAAEDDIILALIKAARQRAERLTSRAFITQTLEAAFDRFDGAMELPHAPLQSVTSVVYVDGAGVSQTLAGSAYTVDSRSLVGRIAPIFGTCWPTVRGAALDFVVVRYVAGYGDDPEDVPEPIRTAIKMMVAAWYDQREAVAPQGLAEVPMGASALLMDYRTSWFG